jgi:primosomal protein N' (replication factor Y)
MYCVISPFSKTFDDFWLIYFVPTFLEWDIKIWQIVEIPIKNLIDIWVILEIINNLDNLVIDYNISKIKSLISIKNPNIFLNNYQKLILPRISKYYFSLIHNSLNLFFPKNLKTKIENWKIDLLKTREYKYRFSTNIKLSNLQNETLKKINNSKNNKILFFWLTWSWKTEIYINLIKKNLDTWKQSLLLVPEIILTTQIFNRIKEIFWEEVIIINSTVSDAIKTKYFIDIYNSSAKIIVWTRSALFYPYNNLWLIIIDEEHDNSYISDTSPRYNTIEIAEKITEINWNKLVLASWTPSFKSMYKSINKDYHLVNLLEKFNN